MLRSIFIAECDSFKRRGDVARSSDCLFSRRLIPFGLALSAALCFLPAYVAAQTNDSAESTESAVQLAQPPGPDQSAPIVTVTLQDAIQRARKNDAQFLATAGDAKSAHEDRLQARNAMLPSVSNSSQFLGTQGNGKTPEGRFVTNDGVHVYREWAVIQENLSPNNYMLTGYRRASAAEAIAKAKTEIAQRGLNATVTKNYYALLVAQRKYATAQQALDQAKRFLDITQQTENAGQAPHSDVIKSQIQYGQQEQSFEETRLAMENARLDLAVLLFPTLNENFAVVDDLDSPQALPPFPEIQTMAGHENPDLRVAAETAREADLDVSAAKGIFSSVSINRNRLRYRGKRLCSACHCESASRGRVSAHARLFCYRQPDDSRMGLGHAAQQTASGGVQAGAGARGIEPSPARIAEQSL